MNRLFKFPFENKKLLAQEYRNLIPLAKDSFPYVSAYVSIPYGYENIKPYSIIDINTKPTRQFVLEKGMEHFHMSRKGLYPKVETTVSLTNETTFLFTGKFSSILNDDIGDSVLHLARKGIGFDKFYQNALIEDLMVYYLNVITNKGICCWIRFRFGSQYWKIDPI